MELWPCCPACAARATAGVCRAGICSWSMEAGPSAEAPASLLTRSAVSIGSIGSAASAAGLPSRTPHARFCVRLGCEGEGEGDGGGEGEGEGDGEGEGEG